MAWPHAGAPATAAATANRMAPPRPALAGRPTTMGTFTVAPLAAAAMSAGPRLHTLITGPLTRAAVSPSAARTVVSPAPRASGGDAVAFTTAAGPGLAAVSGVGAAAAGSAAAPPAVWQPSVIITLVGRAPAAIVTPVRSSLAGHISIT